ncbi:MAG: low temperature requirement protein A [Nonomuraea sp.]|nr:low temperature requirement protein A [Nonomuraea sp.]
MPAEILRSRSGLGGRVAPIELFFDLVYVFAITQLSHLLLEHLSPGGLGQTALLLLAVWWAWMYTTWTTNYLHPDHPAIRFVLVGVMLAGLVMAAAVPQAFTSQAGAFWFAGGYMAIQIGRTIAVTLLSRGEAVQRVFMRVLAWMLVSSVLWIAGALVAPQPLQIVLWAAAVVVEYTAPWHGYRTPFMGRSVTADWTIDGGHMAERCQLFVIIALGESILVTGATLGDHFEALPLTAFVVAFLGSVGLWWIYFDRTAEAAAERIAASDDPGRLGRSAYTFIHLPMVAGIIVSAVGDELAIADPLHHHHGSWWTAAMVLGGPMLFLAGHAMFKRAVFGYVPVNRVLAILAMGALMPFGLPPLAMTVAATVIIWGVAIWDSVLARKVVR